MHKNWSWILVFGFQQRHLREFLYFAILEFGCIALRRIGTGNAWDDGTMTGTVAFTGVFGFGHDTR